MLLQTNFLKPEAWDVDTFELPRVDDAENDQYDFE